MDNGLKGSKTEANPLGIIVLIGVGNNGSLCPLWAKKVVREWVGRVGAHR